MVLEPGKARNQGRVVGSDETGRLPQTVMDVQFWIPDPEIDSHVIR